MTKDFQVMRKKPTEGELEILSILWRHPRATVKYVHETMSRDRDVGYTTVLKMLQIMTDKGLVTRDESERAHCYSAAIGKEATQKHLLLDLADRLFSGSSAALAMRALTERAPSSEELEAIEVLIQRHKSERRS